MQVCWVFLVHVVIHQGPCAGHEMGIGWLVFGIKATSGFCKGEDDELFMENAGTFGVFDAGDSRVYHRF